MSEQTFPSGNWASDDDRATTLVAALLEELLDSISRPDHDWPALSRKTHVLSEIAAAMAAMYPAGRDATWDR